MSSVVLLYITNPNREIALKIATRLLEKRLIACANMFPIDSIYQWEGEVVNDEEIVLLVKTTNTAVSAVTQAVSSLHPYSTPCILVLPSHANDAYSSWVSQQVQNP